MLARHAQLVALAVNLHVEIVPLGELFHGSLDVLHASVLTHLLAGNVGVETGAVPVAGDRFGAEGDFDAEFLGHAM